MRVFAPEAMSTQRLSRLLLIGQILAAIQLLYQLSDLVTLNFGCEPLKGFRKPPSVLLRFEPRQRLQATDNRKWRKHTK
jgi:hypothetical protein